MRNTIGDYLFVVIMPALMGVLFFSLSLFYYSLISAGPDVVFYIMIGATALVIAVSGWFGYLCFGEVMRRPLVLALIYGLSVGAASAVIPVTLLLEGHAMKVYLEDNAPLARDFALQHFDDLDHDHTGTITDKELEFAEEDGRFSNDERALVHLLKTQIDLAGHVTGSYTTMVPIITTISCGNGCVTTVTTMVPSTTYVYGISRGDLPDFPQRAHDKWLKW